MSDVEPAHCYGVAGICLLDAFKKDISKDQIITCADVDLPAGRLCDKLRAEQTSYFAHFVPTD